MRKVTVPEARLEATAEVEGGHREVEGGEVYKAARTQKNCYQRGVVGVLAMF